MDDSFNVTALYLNTVSQDRWKVYDDYVLIMDLKIKIKRLSNDLMIK